METTSFVLGVLTIVAAAISASIVVGLTKINKLTRLVNDLALRVDREREEAYRTMQSENEAIWRQFEACGRDVTMVERTIMQHIDHEIQGVHKHEEELHREIDDTRRYIDSRIDRVVLKGSVQGSKQIIKG